MIIKHFVAGVCFGANVLVASALGASDSHRWLEEIQGEKALSWVHSMNKETEVSLAKDPLYKEVYEQALDALNSKDKLPDVELKGDWLYYLKKNADHPRGIYVRTRFDKFKKNELNWTTVFDIDAMSKQDNVNWVFGGMECLQPANELCLVSLSPGGGDATILREFNAKKLEFVKGGYVLPEAKSNVSWIDKDHLFLGTDFGDGSMTESGYPRLVKIWKRGTPFSTASDLKETDRSSVGVSAIRYDNASAPVDLIVESLTFWKRKYHQLIDGKPVQLSLPETAVVEGVIEGKLVVSLKEDWLLGKQQFEQGALLLISPDELRKASPAMVASVIAQSTPSAIIESVSVMQDSLLLTVLEDIKSVVYRYRRGNQGWQSTRVPLPESGAISIQATHDASGEFIARYEGFLTPPTLFSVGRSLSVKQVLQQSATFDGSNMKVEQYFAKSKDGTQVPYFVVMKKGIKLDGKNPTHIFSYGGFRVSLTPSYSGSYEPHNGIYGKAWLERGGVFVLANIRGGAEYGPAWHSAALLANRHKAFEDFEGIAEDLFKRRITSAKHLGIEGRSNGGLLVGATMVRRPDLYGAVICGVPLLDMKRYNKLLAGASWVGEYGNPDTDDWEFIKTYSPYQLVDKEQAYPPVFFFTSTKDDRVHPGHARKMAARMKAQGHQVEYYENTEGGHKGSATSEQTAKRVALGFTHLWRHLK